MALHLQNLDEVTRRFMLEELAEDVQNGRLYLSPRLTLEGHRQYEALLRAAFTRHDENWLAQQFRLGDLMAAMEPRTRNGKTTMARVPITAPDTLAEGEFNRYYIRGLCRRAIEEGIGSVVVYRAKAVEHPRSESETKIGAQMNPEALLQDVRTHPGVDTALGLPAGPNSGLSVCLP